MTVQAVLLAITGRADRTPVDPGDPPATFGAGFVTQRGNFPTLQERENPATGGHSLMTHWNSLQPTAGAGSTGTHWQQLDTSIGACHADGTRLLIRIMAGIEHVPLWVYTHPTRPVPWINCKASGTRPVQVGVAPQFDPDERAEQTHYPIALQWAVTGPSAAPANPTAAQIRTAVDAGNLRHHWRAFVQNVLTPWLNGPCKADPSHTRAAHVAVIPALTPSVFGTEMTTSNRNPVNGFVLEGEQGARTAVQSNGSTITGATNMVTAYRRAWELALRDMVELLPGNIYVNLMGGILYGNVNVQFELLNGVAEELKPRIVIGRTDLRESYFDGAGDRGAFGGGLAKATSPINLLKTAHRLGVPYCIQTAGDAISAGGASFFDWLPLRPWTVDQYATTCQRFLSHCPKPLFFEGSLSTDEARPAGNDNTTSRPDVWCGVAMSTDAHGGDGPFNGLVPRWPGGFVNIREYLTGPRGFQDQIV